MYFFLPVGVSDVVDTVLDDFVVDNDNNEDNFPVVDDLIDVVGRTFLTNLKIKIRGPWPTSLT